MNSLIRFPFKTSCNIRRYGNSGTLNLVSKRIIPTVFQGKVQTLGKLHSFFPDFKVFKFLDRASHKLLLFARFPAFGLQSPNKFYRFIHCATIFNDCRAGFFTAPLTFLPVGQQVIQGIIHVCRTIDLDSAA